MDQEILPVPLSARRGVLYPAFVWSGFTSAFVCVVIGNRLQSGLGTADALIAVVLGSWLLFVYSAAIGFAAGRWGLNSQLMLEAIFGRLGAVLPGIVLALLVTGWFAFHVMLTAAVLCRVAHIDGGAGIWMIAAIGLFFALPVVAGIAHGFSITAAAYPAMLIFGCVAMFKQVVPIWPSLLDGPLSGSLPFGTGVGVAFGTYAVSGTMTGDIVRYCRTGNEAVQASAIGFLLSNLPFMILGVLIGAAHSDVIELLLDGSWLSLLMLGLIVLSHWATCDACLANAAITLKSVIPRCPWPVVASSAAVIGIVMAATNLVTDVFAWTLFIAAVIPPIGGIIVADYYVVRSHYGFSRARDFRANVPGLIALCVSIAISLWLWTIYPDVLIPLVGTPLAGLLYLILIAVAPASPGASLGSGPLGAEAID